MADPAAIAALRAQIRVLEGGASVGGAREAAGVPEVDRLVGGLPRPGLLELCGAPGSGAARLALALVAAETAVRRRVVWVDRPRALYPPAAHALGVDLDRLLIIRPASADAGVWAIEQVLRSGCFRLVVAVAACGVAEPRAAGVRWRHAAEQGGCTGVFVTRDRAASRALQPDVRLVVGEGRVVVDRDRSGHAGAIGALGAVADPWVVGG